MPSFKINPICRGICLWAASLGTLAALPMATATAADPVTAHHASATREVTLTGQFIDLQALKPGTARSGVAALGTEQLRQEAGLSLLRTSVEPSESQPGLNVYVGQTLGSGRSLSGPGEFFLAARDDGSFVALLPEANTIIRGSADGEQVLTRFDDPHAFHPSQVDYVEQVIEEVPGILEERGKRSLLVDRNQAGEIVIDLLAGFSQKAADFIGDHEAYALAQVAVVNRALKQSQVEGVRLRLVGTQVVAGDYPITTGTLAQVSTLFRDGMRQYSPDLVAGFTMGTPGVDTAVGWAYVNGRYSINYINSSNVFRHEVAHNAGGDHCPDGKSYRFGYNNGRVGTILCGNQVPLYSNPDLRDVQGIPLGDARTANMARVWREKAARMSAYSPAVIPLADEIKREVLKERVTLAKGQWRNFVIDVPEGAQRLLITTAAGEGYDRGNGRSQLLLRRGALPSATQFDARSTENNQPFLALDNPAPGRWHLAIRAEANKPVGDLYLDGALYAATQDTAQARYLKLVAESSIDGKERASAAELHLADAQGRLLSRDGWRVHAVSSAVPASAGGAHAIDGNTSSYWNTVPGDRYPHHMVIDLGGTQRFSSLNYLPQQVRDMEGNIKGYRIYGSDNPNGNWTLLGQGEFSASNEAQAAPLKPEDGGKPPVVVVQGPAVAEAGQQVQLDASGSSDPQGSALSYNWSVAPALDFDIDGPRLTFKAPEHSSDTRYRFSVTVSNGKQTTTRVHELLVKAASGAGATCEATWQPGTEYLQGHKAQWKGRLYEARWWTRNNEPGTAASTGADGSGKVWRDLGPCEASGTPEQPPVILPPVPTISGPADAKAGDRVQLSAAGSTDPNGLNLSYRWSVSPALAFQSDGAGLSFTAPRLDKDADYTFTLTLGNGHHEVTRTHKVRVKAEAPVILPPVAAISGPAEAKAGDRVQLSAAGSTDPNGLNLSYRWSVSPALAFQSDGAGLSFTAPRLDKDADYTFTLTLGNGHHEVTRAHKVRVKAEAGQQPGTCATPWSTSSIYVAGNKVTHKGRTYTARWWTKGNEPGNPAFTGADNTGKVWRDEGACR
ncbi:PKD domain-containing protein [Metapseudomonas otitidis]|uniref:PKD domain-containing protein n=3 Tax=Metapseudomonas otitidis TaxID=319939 RepID=UPI001F10B166|nr:PKD domain-containing protein [Pseudomonas otitidis]